MALKINGFEVVNNNFGLGSSVNRNTLSSSVLVDPSNSYFGDLQGYSNINLSTSANTLTAINTTGLTALLQNRLTFGSGNKIPLMLRLNRGSYYIDVSVSEYSRSSNSINLLEPVYIPDNIPSSELNQPWSISTVFPTPVGRELQSMYDDSSFSINLEPISNSHYIQLIYNQSSINVNMPFGGSQDTFNSHIVTIENNNPSTDPSISFSGVTWAENQIPDAPVRGETKAFIFWGNPGMGYTGKEIGLI